jgi:metal-responsive CopG/Arc/MetJ family transcriptional regulator
MERITCTLPPELVSQIDSICDVIPCSRSALVSLILSENIEVISALATSNSIPRTEDLTYKRARGESINKIADRYREVLDGFEMYL